MDGIIMKSKVVYRALGETRMEWHIIVTPFKKAKRISHKEAMELIEENGLVVVYEEENQKIYDHPDEPFKRKYARTPLY